MNPTHNEPDGLSDEQLELLRSLPEFGGAPIDDHMDAFNSLPDELVVVDGESIGRSHAGNVLIATDNRLSAQPPVRRWVAFHTDQHGVHPDPWVAGLNFVVQSREAADNLAAILNGQQPLVPDGLAAAVHEAGAEGDQLTQDTLAPADQAQEKQESFGSAKEDGPYRIEREERQATEVWWTVIHPDGSEDSTRWREEVDAEEHMEALVAAYAAGQASAPQPDESELRLANLAATLESTPAPVEPVFIARCPEHGLHGERTECFVCGGPVEQVPMFPAPVEGAGGDEPCGTCEGHEIRLTDRFKAFKAIYKGNVPENALARFHEEFGLEWERCPDCTTKDKEKGRSDERPGVPVETIEAESRVAGYEPDDGLPWASVEHIYELLRMIWRIEIEPSERTFPTLTYRIQATPNSGVAEYEINSTDEFMEILCEEAERCAGPLPGLTRPEHPKLTATRATASSEANHDAGAEGDSNPETPASQVVSEGAEGSAEAPSLSLADETRRRLEVLAKAVEQIDTDAVSPVDVAGWIREVAATQSPSPTDDTAEGEGR